MEKVWVEVPKALSLERKCLHCTGQYSILCVPPLRYNTRQIDRVQQRISEPYEHYCFLRDNIEKKKKNTFERENSSV